MMQIEYKTPAQLGIIEVTRTKWIAVIYEDDDVEKKYPTYRVAPFFTSKNEFSNKLREEDADKRHFAVFKNDDFTNARSPMSLNKFFTSRVQAEEYVASQEGAGHSQYRKLITGVNVYGDAFCYIIYNGFDIRRMTIQY